MLSKSKEIENDLILIGKTPSKVDELKDSLLGSIRKIRAGVDINEIHKADIILICTSSHDAVVHQHMVKSGVVIYDVTQPKNTSKELQHRKDLSYIDGGYISAPESIYIKANIGLPPNALFSCLSETILLSKENIDYPGVTEKIDLDYVNKIGLLAKKYDFNTYYISHNG